MTDAERAPEEGVPAAPGPTLRPGMSGTVDIYTRSVPEAVVVPIQAVTARDFNEVERERRRRAEALGEDVPDTDIPEGEDVRRVVFVVVDGKAEMREVTTGINFNNIIPGRARRTRHLLARGERHVPLGRPASIDHGNTFHEIFLQAGVLTIHRVCRVKAALAWQLQNLFSAG